MVDELRSQERQEDGAVHEVHWSENHLNDENPFLSFSPVSRMHKFFGLEQFSGDTADSCSCPVYQDEPISTGLYLHCKQLVTQ